MSEKDEMNIIEAKARLVIDDFPSFTVSFEKEDEAKFKDDRDYVDKMFKDFSKHTGVTCKKTQGLSLPDSYKVLKDEPERMFVLFNYKAVKTQGKRDPLAGNHVLAIPSGKGHQLIPLDQVRKYALQLLKLSDALEDQLFEDDLSDKPENLFN